MIKRVSTIYPVTIERTLPVQTDDCVFIFIFDEKKYCTFVYYIKKSTFLTNSFGLPSYVYFCEMLLCIFS